nr:hypothetical protein [Patescibacteria group bacterium]
MGKKLTRKEKITLILVALVIFNAWLIPVFISKGRFWYENYKISKNPKEHNIDTKIKPKSDLVKAVEQYLEELRQAPHQEQENILGIKNPIISRYEVVSTVGNEKKAQVKVRIYIVNSYLEKEIFLSRNNDSWKVLEIKGPNDLVYERNGIILIHPPDWEVYSTTNNEDALAEWSFKTAGGETKAIFFIEEKGGNFSEAFMGCSLDVVTNCDEKELGERVLETALFQKLIGVYVLEGEESK